MARKPDPEKRELWRRRLAEFGRGEWSVAEFCRRQGVSQAAFYQWRRKLGRLAPGPHGTVAGVSFLPVTITGHAASPAERLEVQLVNGARVLVPCHAQEAIRTVIGTLLDAFVSERAEEQGC